MKLSTHQILDELRLWSSIFTWQHRLLYNRNSTCLNTLTCNPVQSCPIRQFCYGLTQWTSWIFANYSPLGKKISFVWYLIIFSRFQTMSVPNLMLLPQFFTFTTRLSQWKYIFQYISIENKTRCKERIDSLNI